MMADIPKLFLRDSIGQVPDIQRRHKFVLGNIELRHTVIASHQLVSHGVVDAKVPILDVLISQRIIRICRLLVSMYVT